MVANSSEETIKLNKKVLKFLMFASNYPTFSDKFKVK